MRSFGDRSHPHEDAWGRGIETHPKPAGRSADAEDIADCTTVDTNCTSRHCGLSELDKKPNQEVSAGQGHKSESVAVPGQQRMILMYTPDGGFRVGIWCLFKFGYTV